ncbi:RidA family protein [Aestuariibacter sp. GS-14]|uniref:RidA family protein n=1 Tax=Aestuariibacter sp. GS-14 TaxID=2590670 RepID=UPI00112BD074|nr:RidA family protein [Aestuariibacter sp. GS-14]TPV59981.1 RidA family protein [Aestuariibacter sp. GS-14]
MATDIIYTIKAPSPGGHYVQALKHEGLLYISGQLSFPPEGPTSLNDNFTEQAAQAFENVGAVLNEAGLDFSHILQLRAYIVGIENWPAFDQVCAQYLQEYKPARAVVPVPTLHYGCMVELEAVARVISTK